jgi:predicted regulator of Ras-like GTPase activity (Roadblock/LC7/MglB family)
LQLIEIENQTRLLEIRSNHNEKGYIYLNDGVLYNAVCGDLKGEAAIQGMLQWKKTRIEFKNLPKEKIKRQIHTKINDFFSKNDKPNNETLDSNEERPSIESDINSESTEAEIEDELQEQDASNAPAIYQISENHLEERRHKKMALENEIFEPLKKISGFVGSIIYSGTGEVILADAPSTINTDEVGGLAIELYKNARAIAERMKMGIADLVEVRTESHYFLHACIVPGKGALGVLMLRDGNIGLMRHTMRRISESLVPDFS